MTETHARETRFGFEYGSLVIERCCSDVKKGWVMVTLHTPRHKRGMQVYVTRTGKIRVFDDDATELKRDEKARG